MSEIVRAALASIVEGGTLSMDEARAAMGAVMDGEATPAQLAALLMGLRMRGETVDELAGFAAAMRERVVRVDAPDGAIDVVGTGGDGSGTFNISTTAALVTAAAGVPVAKHGNRAMTSRSGSADVLDALGVRIDHDAASAGAALRDHGFAFMFAPNFHPAMKYAGPTRREIGVRTAFNLVGPLTNPAGTKRQLLGVGDARGGGPHGRGRPAPRHGADLRDPRRRGRRAAARRQRGGLHRRRRHASSATSSTPSALGFKRAATAKLSGGDPAENARMTEAVLRGEPGARRDVVLLNAAAALLVGGAVEQMEEGIERAALTIDAGLASELLETLREERRVADAAAAAARPTEAAADRAGTGMTVADRPTRSRAARHQRRRGDRRPAPRRHPGRGRRGRTRADDRGRVGRRHRHGRSPNASPHPGSTSSPRSSARRRRPAGSRRRDEDIVARARAYEAGGAAAISVLCEPHWFGGSVDDLRAVRAAVAVPVLAKDFVVEEIQLPMLRAAGADLVLLLAVLHPAKRLARLVERALEIGLEPLVEVHDARELERALASGARLIGLNNRDLRTLESWTSSRPRDSGSSSRTIGSSSPNRASASRASSLAGGRSGSMARSSVRRSSARPTRPPPLEPSSPPGPRQTIRPTSRAGRRSRSVASPTPTGSSRRSPPGRMRSG